MKSEIIFKVLCEPCFLNRLKRSPKEREKSHIFTSTVALIKPETFGLPNSGCLSELPNWLPHPRRICPWCGLRMTPPNDWPIVHKGSAQQRTSSARLSTKTTHHSHLGPGMQGQPPSRWPAKFLSFSFFFLLFWFLISCQLLKIEILRKYLDILLLFQKIKRWMNLILVGLHFDTMMAYSGHGGVFPIGSSKGSWVHASVSELCFLHVLRLWSTKQ